MTKQQEKELKKNIREIIDAQFRRGMKEGAYGMAGAIYDKIQNFKGRDYALLIEEISHFLHKALGLINKE